MTHAPPPTSRWSPGPARHCSRTVQPSALPSAGPPGAQVPPPPPAESPMSSTPVRRSCKFPPRGGRSVVSEHVTCAQKTTGHQLHPTDHTATPLSLLTTCLRPSARGPAATHHHASHAPPPTRCALRPRHPHRQRPARAGQSFPRASLKLTTHTGTASAAFTERIQAAQPPTAGPLAAQTPCLGLCPAHRGVTRSYGFLSLERAGPEGWHPHDSRVTRGMVRRTTTRPRRPQAPGRTQKDIDLEVRSPTGRETRDQCEQRPGARATGKEHTCGRGEHGGGVPGAGRRAAAPRGGRHGGSGQQAGRPGCKEQGRVSGAEVPGPQAPATSTAGPQLVEATGCGGSPGLHLTNPGRGPAAARSGLGLLA